MQIALPSVDSPEPAFYFPQAENMLGLITFWRKKKDNWHFQSMKHFYSRESESYQE